MARCFVEFGAYGAIGDFKVEEDMTEETICTIVHEIAEEFMSSEIGWTIIEDGEEY